MDVTQNDWEEDDPSHAKRFRVRRQIIFFKEFEFSKISVTFGKRLFKILKGFEFENDSIITF